MTILRKIPLRAWLAGLLLAAGTGWAAAQNAPAPAASPNANNPADEPTTTILSDTAHYDDVNKRSNFTGNVVMTRGLMTLHSDTLDLREDKQGNQFGTALASKGKIVTVTQERPETFERIEGTGLRAEYDGSAHQVDLIGQAIVIRYICGKQFDTIRGEKVRYYEKSGTYEAIGGPGSSAPNGRVRSVVEPRAKTQQAIDECRKSQPGGQSAASTPPAKPAAKPSTSTKGR
jgi:lipopolysaccharide export system protein LptA